MNLKILRNVTLGLALVGAGTAQAVPVTGVYIEDPRCDTLPNQFLSHELGDINSFPINEAFIVNSVSHALFTVCVPDDGIANDWIVDITNASGIAWKDLYFVADLGMTVGNADGSMVDAIGAPSVLTDAFKIKGTVTPGLNSNLLGESGIVDEIFSPGESWRFNVSNFQWLFGAPPVPPIFQTPGVFAGSAPVLAPPINTASILATPVPEPSVLGALGIVAAVVLTRRPRVNRA